MCSRDLCNQKGAAGAASPCALHLHFNFTSRPLKGLTAANRPQRGYRLQDWSRLWSEEATPMRVTREQLLISHVPFLRQKRKLLTDHVGTATRQQ